MKPLRILGISVAVILVLLAIVGIRHQAVVDAEWTAMQERVETIRTELEGRVRTRPVLWGEPQPGDSWTGYRTAAELVGGGAPDPVTARSAWIKARQSGDLEAAAAERDALLAAFGPAVDALREAGRREIDYTGFRWDADQALQTANLLHMRNLANLAVMKANAALEGGDAVDAAQWILDGAQLGRDLMERPLLIDNMIGCAILTIPLWEALIDQQHVPLGELSSSALETLEVGLERLEASLDLRYDSMLNEVVFMVESPVYAHELGSSFRAWRFGFSERLMLADYTREMEELCRELLAAPVEGVAAAEALETFTRSCETSSNEWTRMWGPSSSARTSTLHALALLRMTRVAVRYRLDGTTLELQDPFCDDPLQTNEGVGTLSIWSVGPDGKGLASHRPLRAEVARAVPSTPR